MRKISEFILNEETEKLTVGQFNLNKMTDEIEKHISKLIGVKVEVICQIKGDMITLTSKDLASNMKPKMFKELKLHNFGGNVLRDEPFYWMPVHFNYSHFDGGSNGCKITDLFFNQDGTIHVARDSIK